MPVSVVGKGRSAGDGQQEETQAGRGESLSHFQRLQHLFFHLALTSSGSNIR